MVLGAGGAGKSTFALELSRAMSLPVIHLDRHYWRPGWVEPSPTEWHDQVVELSAADEWIMDGNYSRTLGPRLERAEVAVLLDPPPWQCLWGILARSTVLRSRPRPDLPEGCPEQLPDWDFVRYVATYRWRSRPTVVRRIQAATHVRFHHCRSRPQAKALLGGCSPLPAGPIVLP